MELIKFDEMKKTWHKIARYNDGDVSPSFELEVYKKMLDIFHIGEFYYYIVNIARVEMEYVSENVKKVLGLKAAEDFTVEYIYDNIHPDDKARFIAHEGQVTIFFNALPPEKVLKYKVSYDYRLRGADGRYVWVLMQTITIQSDERGAVIRVLGIQTNISHLKTDNTPSGLSFIGLEGEPSYLNVDITVKSIAPSPEIFTRREKEVLKMIVEGKTTKDIAQHLHLSKHTINTHRKNILSKSGCQNLAELLVKTIREGWV